MTIPAATVRVPRVEESNFQRIKRIYQESIDARIAKERREAEEKRVALVQTTEAAFPGVLAEIEKTLSEGKKLDFIDLSPRTDSGKQLRWDTSHLARLLLQEGFDVAVYSGAYGETRVRVSGWD